VVLTFDDGYQSTLDVAAPVLSRLSLPAIVYLPTAHIDRRAPQFIDTLYGAFAHRTRQRLALPRQGIDADLHDGGRVRAVYLLVADRLSFLDDAARATLLAEIVDQLAPSRPPPRLTMGWDDVRQLLQRHPGFELGVHTRDHLDLTACDSAVSRAQLKGSIDDVRHHAGVVARHFAFPFGRSCTRAVDDVRAVALASAAVTEPATLVRRGADVFRLPRLMAPATARNFAFLTGGAWPDASLALFHRA
jgi:peptidoglycan/xylan/chitin deacetylase (PgdA/CDA1 family)